MGKYIGITIVLLLGIAAIGIVSYQANLLQQTLLAGAARTDIVPAHTQHERLVITLGSISFVPLVPQMLPSLSPGYALAQNDGEAQPGDMLAANVSRTNSKSTVLPATSSDEAWRSFRWIWKQPAYVPPAKPVATSTAPTTTPKTTTATTTKPTTTTAPSKTATTTTIKPATATTTKPTTATTTKPTTATTTAPKTPTTTPATTPAAPAPNPVSTGKLKWGVFAGDSNDNISTVEKLVGKAADIQAVFSGFSDPFPDYVSGLCPNKTLLIFWENTGYSLDNIIAGKYDSYLKSFSSGAQKYGCPVMLSLFHEMNGNWDDWDGPVGNNSPAKIISAWKHIHDLVTASNVKWAWAVNNVSVPDTAANKADVYYPGDAYVDYVGVDGFNFNDPWTSFSGVFDTAIANLQKYNKPIYIFSMGAVANSKKAAWIADGLGVQVKKYKNLAGWVWFNQNGGDGNWSINSDAASLAAFIAALP